MLYETRDFRRAHAVYSCLQNSKNLFSLHLLDWLASLRRSNHVQINVGFLLALTIISLQGTLAVNGEVVVALLPNKIDVKVKLSSLSDIGDQSCEVEPGLCVLMNLPQIFVLG